MAGEEEARGNGIGSAMRSWTGDVGKYAACKQWFHGRECGKNTTRCLTLHGRTRYHYLSL
eukprot:scaffold48225_cov31-Tisochrysis_lutea.AAC.3